MCFILLEPAGSLDLASRSSCPGSLCLDPGRVLCLSASVPRKAPFEVCSVASLICASAMEPTMERERERERASWPQIWCEPCVARKDTLAKQAVLLNDFRIWLFEVHGVMLATLLTAKPQDPEEICRFLVQYGQEGKFSETIHAVAAVRPAVRKQLMAAPSLPISLALSWGWPVEATVFGLAWTGMLRIGEVLMACRDDFILPRDAAPGVFFALLRISTLKTRGRAAKHQAARVDRPDIITLLDAVFWRVGEEWEALAFFSCNSETELFRFTASSGAPNPKGQRKAPFWLRQFAPRRGHFHVFGARRCWMCAAKRQVGQLQGLWHQSRGHVNHLHRKTDWRYQKMIHQLASFPRILNIAIMFLRIPVPPRTWYRLYQAEDTVELWEVWEENGKFASFRPT